MSRKLLNKRILITDYYLRDPELYKDVVSILYQEGANVFALLNVTTRKGDFIHRYPKCIPIVLNTCRLYEQNIDGDDLDVNKITFKDGPQRELMDNLPMVDYVINFAGPEFVQIFSEKNGQSPYRVLEIEFSKIKSKLEAHTLFPPDCSNTIVHVVPNKPIINKLFKVPNSREEKDKHYVQAAFGSAARRNSDAGVAMLPMTATPAGLFSRYSVLRRSLSLRIRRSFVRRVFGEIPPSNVTEEKQRLLNKEVNKLRKRLNETYFKSMKACEKKREKCIKGHEKKEEKLNKKIRQDKTKFLEECRESTGNEGPATTHMLNVISPETQQRLDESKQRSAEKHALKSTTRAFRMESRDLENKFQQKIKNLEKSWYENLLCEEAKVIRKITKSFVEKGKAVESVLQQSN